MRINSSVSVVLGAALHAWGTVWGGRYIHSLRGACSRLQKWPWIPLLQASHLFMRWLFRSSYQEGESVLPPLMSLFWIMWYCISKKKGRAMKHMCEVCPLVGFGNPGDTHRLACCTHSSVLFLQLVSSQHHTHTWGLLGPLSITSWAHPLQKHHSVYTESWGAISVVWLLSCRVACYIAKVK